MRPQGDVHVSGCHHDHIEREQASTRHVYVCSILAQSNTLVLLSQCYEIQYSF